MTPINKRLLILFLMSLLLISCGNDEKTYDSGYNDGFAEGYNTQCQIRATIVYGHWDSAEYSKRYNAGRNDGAQACIVDKRNNNVR